ncbi:hypothetical protein D3C72_1547390 [compost metagenome]
MWRVGESLPVYGALRAQSELANRSLAFDYSVQLLGHYPFECSDNLFGRASKAVFEEQCVVHWQDDGYVLQPADFQ